MLLQESVEVILNKDYKDRNNKNNDVPRQIIYDIPFLKKAWRLRVFHGTINKES